jgi:hypothetical protein
MTSTMVPIKVLKNCVRLIMIKTFHKAAETQK